MILVHTSGLEKYTCGFPLFKRVESFKEKKCFAFVLIERSKLLFISVG